MKDLRDLLDHEVQAMYSAEKLIAAGLPRMIQNASSSELKQAFQTHLDETEHQIQRLEQVADLLEIDVDGDKNLGMAGIIAEGEQVMHKDATPEALDAALICGAQKVEHYEIAGYGTAVYLAQELGFDQVATILDGILDEEKRTNGILNSLAKTLVNPLAE
ncbi:ferritin-like domain-containing protein [Hymenobacter sp. BT664]|uniref:Ferritin-like domain-containing protein n=1 Tax=Hymenobacter montanus TaxID=2771359 RepID=A0A927BE47_9BACT|nr:ferritin-like domain-containing protein [Hymenobacter montanus]